MRSACNRVAFVGKCKGCGSIVDRVEIMCMMVMYVYDGKLPWFLVSFL